MTTTATDSPVPPPSIADYPARLDPAALPFTDADIAGMSHAHAFDPTAGYKIADLVAMPTPTDEPEDFADFWQETRERAMLGSSIPALEPTYEELPPIRPGVRTWKIGFTSWGCLRIGAWLHEPADIPPRGLMLHGHGYGAPSPDPTWATRGYAVMQLCQRGFALSLNPEVPANSSVKHVINGIEHRDTYILRGCVVEQWHAASLLLHRYPQLEDRLVYVGGSFGGGMGALAIPWDPRFRAACLAVPTFGHQKVRLSHVCSGSGEAVRRHQRRCPELLETLPYYDAATAARYFRIPVLSEVACFDPAVIPPGQWAVANAITSAGSRLMAVPAGHHDPPPSLWSPAHRGAAERVYMDFLDRNGR